LIAIDISFLGGAGINPRTAWISLHASYPVADIQSVPQRIPRPASTSEQKAFDVTVARLRRLLACDAAVIVFDHRGRLNGEIVWTDVQALGAHLARGEAAAAGSVDAGAAFDAAHDPHTNPAIRDT